jgi:1-deoxy-D-xylulose-5-phosphate synthase
MPTGDAIAVIGDGAITAGMAYEAMNHAGHDRRRLFVILNDNDMSIAPPVGAMSRYLTRLQTTGPGATFRDLAAGFEAALPGPLRDHARKARQLVTGMPGGGTLFEELGFTYIGPVDGHSMPELLATCAPRGRGPRGRC